MLNSQPARSDPSGHLAPTANLKCSPATIADGTSQTVSSTACDSTRSASASSFTSPSVRRDRVGEGRLRRETVEGFPLFVWRRGPSRRRAPPLRPLLRDLTAGDIALNEPPAQAVLLP